MTAPSHIINELVFEVNTSNLKTAFYLKDNAEVLLKEYIYPQLELCFNSFGNKTDAQIVRFKNITIETHVDDVTSFEAIGINVISNMQDQLKQKGVFPAMESHSIYTGSDSMEEQGAIEIERTTYEQSNADAVLYFIENGRLPWWHEASSFFSIEQLKTTVSRSGFTKRFKQLLAQKNARQRIIHQFDDLSIALLVGLGDTSRGNLKEKEINSVPFLFQNSKLRSAFWQAIFDYLEQKNEENLFADLPELISESSQVTTGNGPLEFKTEKAGLKNTLRFFNFVNKILGSGFYLKKNQPGKTNATFYTLSLNQTQDWGTAVAKNSKLMKAVTASGKTEIRIDLRTPRDSSSTISDNSGSDISANKNLDNSANKKNIRIKELPGDAEAVQDSTKEQITSEKISSEKISSEKNTTKNSRSNEEILVEMDFDIENRDSSVLVEEGTIFPNAGLILLHPFLKRFFENLELLNNNALQPTKLEEALHIMHYLACKKEQPYEHELLFEKFICNVPLKHPVKRDIKLSKKQKDSCDVLLQSALNHWEGLKTNSVDALRSEFLMREGRLLTTTEHYKLFVQRKTQDILLETLPWNLSLAKIPWKKKMILIDW